MLSVGWSGSFAVFYFVLYIISIQACSFVYTKPGVITANAEFFLNISVTQCTYFVKSFHSSETVSLELMELVGFPQIFDSSEEESKCFPRLDIFEVQTDGQEDKTVQICSLDDVTLPKVFHITTSLAKIVFVMPLDDMNGRFKMNFKFLSRSSVSPNPDCCTGCQTGVARPPCFTSTYTDDMRLGSSEVTLRLCIGLAVFVIMGLILGVFVYCIRTRDGVMCSCRRNRSLLGSREPSDLPQSLHSRKVTKERTCESFESSQLMIPVSSNAKQQVQQQQQLQKQLQLQLQQQRDNINYPSHVLRSLDGEEEGGYWACQKRLKHESDMESNYVELYRPPPNKTVADCESPPPRANRTLPDPRVGAVV